jgi:anti-sigma factor RsiW
MLNAYVDGALSSEEASHIAQRAAASPEIANRIAMLHHLKAGVAGIAEETVIGDQPLPLTVAPTRRGLSQWVAGLAGLAVLAAAALFIPTPVRLGTVTDALIEASGDRLSGFTAVHDEWIALEVATAGRPRVKDWLQDVMQETGLSLVRESALHTDDGTSAVHFAFLGPKGCRLSLFEVASDGEESEGLDISITGSLLAAKWTDAERSYALVTRNMDSARFAAIAAAVHDATRSRGAVDPQLLANVREARQPCLS